MNTAPPCSYPITDLTIFSAIAQDPVVGAKSDAAA